MKKIVSKAPTKSYELDPLSTKLLKQFNDVILPMVLEIINTSIYEANVPEVLKKALLRPLQKKAGLDLVFPNYQPVSNLTFVSKLIERVICKQLTEYTKSTGMTEHYEVELCSDLYKQNRFYH